MASPANELQAAVFGLLTADAGVAALVGTRIYDRVPMASDVPPYITFGPADEYEDDADCIRSSNHSLQIDVWSEKQGGFKECKEITHAVNLAIHQVSVNLPSHALTELRVTRRLHFRDPDGITSHGVVTVGAIIEENNG
jgi:hypothetical protein